MATPLSAGEIAKKIQRIDPSFKSVIKKAGHPPVRRSAPVAKRFPALASSITSQLLATSAAETIHARVVSVCKGTINEKCIIKAGAEKLKSAGLNRTKAEAMVQLAEMSIDRSIQLDRHGRMSNEAIEHEITAVKGIGPWTVQMYLMHTLARHDVWPVGDYGVRMGWSILHDMDEIISEKELRIAGEPLTGLRSSVAWYCWQAVHFFRLEK